MAERSSLLDSKQQFASNSTPTSSSTAVASDEGAGGGGDLNTQQNDEDKLSNKRRKSEDRKLKIVMEKLEVDKVCFSSLYFWFRTTFSCISLTKSIYFIMLFLEFDGV